MDAVAANSGKEFVENDSRRDKARCKSFTDKKTMGTQRLDKNR